LAGLIICLREGKTEWNGDLDISNETKARKVKGVASPDGLTTPFA